MFSIESQVQSPHKESDFDPDRCETLVPEKGRLGRKIEARWLICMFALDRLRSLAEDVMAARDTDPQLYDRLMGRYLGVTRRTPTEDLAVAHQIGQTAYGDRRVALRLDAIDRDGAPRRWVFCVSDVPMAARWSPTEGPAGLDGGGAMTLLSGRTPWMPSQQILLMSLSDPKLRVLDVVSDAASHLGDTCEKALKDVRTGAFAHLFAHSIARKAILKADASSTLHQAPSDPLDLPGTT